MRQLRNSRRYLKEQVDGVYGFICKSHEGMGGSDGHTWAEGRPVPFRGEEGRDRGQLYEVMLGWWVRL